MSSQIARPIVFCDFDGTITVNETLRKVFTHFVPHAADKILADFDAKKISLRQALIDLVAALPSSYEKSIIEFVQGEPIRDGFGELLVYLEKNKIPFVVLSSGFAFYIEAMLAPWRKKIHAIRALDIDRSGVQMQLRITHDHPTDAMPKERVMYEYGASARIVIGDSRSDFLMANDASFVFARDSLLAEMRRLNKPCFAYESFFDVIRQFDEIDQLLN